MTRFGRIVTLAALAPAATSAFSPVAPAVQLGNAKSSTFTRLFAEEELKDGAVFVAAEAADVDADAAFNKVESLGKGSAKVRKSYCGKRYIKYLFNSSS
jgi:hypothetical protein